MYSVTRLVEVAEPHRTRMLAALRDLAGHCGARRAIVQPTLPGSRNGGDILLHLRFESETQWFGTAPRLAAVLADDAVGAVNGAAYHGAPIRCGDPAGTVYRSLLLRVHPDTEPAAVARFEHELALMPRYISSIRAWQLSPVAEAVGATAWTHVFEQEFTDLAGLMGPYLMHPIHWAVVDRWFDPESTDVIVRDRVCHSFAAMTGPILH